MKIASAFPSKYLRASDIPEGRNVSVIIDRVHVENVAGTSDNDDEKPVLYFQGKQKGMVLNKTNSSTISAAYGDETDDWTGKTILLYASETTFQGKTMPCLRVKIPKAPPVAAKPPVAAPKVAAEQPFGEEAVFDESEIPF